MRRQTSGDDGVTGVVDEVVPTEPPARVRSELLWRLAALLYREHRPDGHHCSCCHQPWPCSGRRLAELGLRRAGAGR